MDAMEAANACLNPAEAAIQTILGVLEENKQRLSDGDYKHGIEALQQVRAATQLPCTLVVMRATTAIDVDFGRGPRFRGIPEWEYIKVPAVFRRDTIDAVQQRLTTAFDITSLRGPWARDLDPDDAARLEAVMKAVADKERHQYLTKREEVEIAVQTKAAIIALYCDAA